MEFPVAKIPAPARVVAHSTSLTPSINLKILWKRRSKQTALGLPPQVGTKWLLDQGSQTTFLIPLEPPKSNLMHFFIANRHRFPVTSGLPKKLTSTL